jgi:hypothetical protein
MPRVYARIVIWKFITKENELANINRLITRGSRLHQTRRCRSMRLLPLLTVYERRMLLDHCLTDVLRFEWEVDEGYVLVKYIRLNRIYFNIIKIGQKWRLNNYRGSYSTCRSSRMVWGLHLPQICDVSLACTVTMLKCVDKWPHTHTNRRAIELLVLPDSVLILEYHLMIVPCYTIIRELRLRVKHIYKKLSQDSSSIC